MVTTLPYPCLLLLVGPGGSGKTTFAQNHFTPTQVVSSDKCRAMISDDENDQSVSYEAFKLLYHIVSKRVMLRKLTVVDATNTQKYARKRLIEINKRFGPLPAAAIVFNLPEQKCIERDANRKRSIGQHIIRSQYKQFRQSLNRLPEEGFSPIIFLSETRSVEQHTLTLLG
ncbi:protein serine-threonine phosphatase [Chitinispirillum alkaliphilum]|nr:protein serine-threonine phosphatase [Chitinispirillum alkaliphilum]